MNSTNGQGEQMERDDYRDETRDVQIGADIVIALVMCAVAALGMLAAFLLIELARVISA